MSKIEDGVGFPITATDQFSGQFEKLKQQVSGAASAMSGLTGMFAAFAGGVGVAGFSALIKGSIDAQARMKDLAQEAGTSASAISRFEEPARMAGLSLDAVSGAMFKMSKAAIEARNPASNAAQALRSIGVSTEQLKGMKPDEMFEQVARSLGKYGDGLQKNAVMQELFGKSGREMNRVVAEIAEGGKLSATVTDEQAEAADRLQDQIVKLHMESEKFWRSLASDAVGPLTAVLKAFTEGKREAGLYEGAVRALTEAFDQINGTGPAAELQKIEERIKEATKAAEILERKPWWSIFGQDSLKAQAATLEGLTKQRDALRHEIHQLELAAQDNRARLGQKPPPAFDPKGLEAAAKATKDLALANEHANVEERHRIELGKIANAETQHAIDLDQRHQDAIAGQIRGVRQYAENIEFETSLMGLSNAERAKAIALRQLEAVKAEVGADAIEKMANRIRDSVAAQEAMRDQASIWDEMSSAAGNFFSDLVMNGRDAFDNLKQWAKQLLADMIALFAKRWVLNLAVGGSMMSSAGSALAGGVGNGSMAGAGLGGILPGGTLGTAFGNVANMGASMLGASGSLASMVGQAASFIPVIGAVVGLGMALYSIFKDKGENPNFRWMQGLGGEGAFGGISTQGNFSFDDAALQRIIGGLDARVARALGPSGVATGTAGLQGYTAAGLRQDGQPAQFAIPPGSEAAGAEQIARELLQSRYGILFEGIDAGIAAQIREWSGSSTELEQFITSTLDIIDGLAGLNARGLNITSLQAMQRTGEGLGDTFQRVASEMAGMTDLFTSDEERLTGFRANLAGFFADLATQGEQIPQDNAAWLALFKSLDLGTEAGRELHDRMVALAPAFLAVGDAARTLMANFDQIMGQMRGPTYTSGLNQAGLQSATERFMQANAWTTGMDWQYVSGQILTIQRSDFQRYSATSQALINEILGYQLTQAAAPIEDFGSSMGSATDAVASYTDTLAQAQASLRGWAVDKMLGNLSALSGDEKYAFALDEYQRAVGSGDLGLFRDSADALLGAGRDRYASGEQYTELFNRVMADSERLGGFSLGRDVNTSASIDQMRAELAIELRAANAKSDALQMQVRDLIATLRETSKEQTTATRDAARDTATVVVGAVESMARN